jgi:hypothetical protein
MATVGAVGRYRGARSRSNVSMMIMRAPQQGKPVPASLRLRGLVSQASARPAARGLARRCRWRGVVEQAVVADAVEAAGQYVDQKTPDKLGGGERHHLVSFAAFDPGSPST